MSHYKLIKRLVAEIRTLRNENYSLVDSYNSLSESFAYAQERMEIKTKQLRTEKDRVERQCEMERQEQQSKDWQRENAMKNLEKAEAWGDQWGIDRAKRDLKNL